jgi:hypothetical protein
MAPEPRLILKEASITALERVFGGLSIGSLARLSRPASPLLADGTPHLATHAAAVSNDTHSSAEGITFVRGGAACRRNVSTHTVSKPSRADNCAQHSDLVVCDGADRALAQQKPIVRLVDNLPWWSLLNAVQRRASDIHLHPREHSTDVRSEPLEPASVAIPRPPSRGRALVVARPRQPDAPDTGRLCPNRCSRR